MLAFLALGWLAVTGHVAVWLPSMPRGCMSAVERSGDSRRRLSELIGHERSWSPGGLPCGQRIIPEAIAGAIWIAFECGLLATPVDSVGPCGWVLLGGIALRLGLFAAVLLHEAGHAAVAAISTPGCRSGSFLERLADTREQLALRSVLPMQRIFIPGLSPAPEAPSVPGTTRGWRTRVTALAGPLSNVLTALSLSQLLSEGPRTDFLSLAITALLAGQVLALLTSWSDFETVFIGSAARLFCGNVVVLGKVNRVSPAQAHASRERRMWWQVVVRGGQSGGRFILTKKGFIGWKGLNPKRAKLPWTVDRNYRLARFWAWVRGVRPLEGIYQTQSHIRFATSGASTQNTTQPLSWRPAHTVKGWCINEGRLTKSRRTQHHLFCFNGDIHAWVRPTDDPTLRMELFGTVWSGPELQRLLTKILGAKPVGCDPDGIIRTDTILGAGIQELLLTQGRWGDSFRMAFALSVAENPEHLDLLTDAVIREFDAVGDEVFRWWLEENKVSTVGCRTLLELSGKAAPHLDGLIHALEKKSLSIRDLKGRLNQARRGALIRACVDGFFHNDLREAARGFAEYARGTFAAVLQSSLHPGEVSLISFKQPLYIGVHAAEDPEEDFQVVASEAASVFVSGNPGPDGQPQRPAYLYLMRDLELAHIHLHPGTARSTISFREGFSRGDPETTQTLTPSHLEDWARRSETDGGRGWVSLVPSNRYFQDKFPRLGVRDPVREGLDGIPALIASIQASWADASSLNRRTAEAFIRFILTRVLRAEAVSGQAGGPTQNAQLDLLILGAGESLVVAGAFAEDVRRLFPKLHILSIDSKTFAIAPESIAVGPDTVVLGVSHSGQYFNTLDDVKFLRAVHECGGCGPVFALTGQMATLLGQAVGQSFKAGAPFGERIFTDGAGWRLEEPHGLTTVAAHFTLSQLLLRLADAAYKGNSWAGLGVSSDDLQFLRSRIGESGAKAEEITGCTAKGYRLESPVHRNLHREGGWLSWFLIEPLVVSVLSVLHLAVVFSLGANPVTLAMKTLPDALVNMASPALWSCVLVYGQVAYFFLMAPVIITMLMRLVRGRPLADRFTGRNLYIADRGWVASLTESFVRRLFALGYGFSGFQDPKSGDIVAGFIDAVAPSITRGDVLVKGVPVDDRVRATTTMVSTQLRGGPSLNQSAYAVGIGQEHSSRHKFHRFVSVGGAPPASGSVSATARQIDESRTSALYRLIGHYVMFHKLASCVQAVVNRILPLINLIGAPVFLLMYLLSLGRWRIWFRPWDISETQSRANIFTTSVAPPIALRPDHYRPLLWEPPLGHRNGSDEGDVILASPTRWLFTPDHTGAWTGRSGGDCSVQERLWR